MSFIFANQYQGCSSWKQPHVKKRKNVIRLRRVSIFPFSSNLTDVNKFVSALDAKNIKTKVFLPMMKVKDEYLGNSKIDNFG